MLPRQASSNAGILQQLFRTGLLLGFILWATGAATAVHAVELGLQAGRNITHSDENFEQYEIVANWPLPWKWRWAGCIQVETRLNTTAGVLAGEGETAVLGTLGPAFVFGADNRRLEVIAGSSLTFISRHRFDEEDFGGFFQFTHHVGLRYRFTERVSAGLRLQHMSNADIYDHNPGLDLGMVTVSYHF
jgi:lipid A 3-O-deacylase